MEWNDSLFVIFLASVSFVYISRCVSFEVTDPVTSFDRTKNECLKSFNLKGHLSFFDYLKIQFIELNI